MARQEGQLAPAPSQVTPLVGAVLRSGRGRPLDADARTFMEPRFGHDFSQVRVHTDAEASASAEAVNALAYTVGQDVVFRSGQYAPGTTTGRRLLAHELTHVVQQQAAQPIDTGVAEASAPDETMEAPLQRSVEPSRASGRSLQRSDDEEQDPSEKSRESKPRDAPRGTKPIDQWGFSKDEVHKIKKGVSAGPREWVGITPDGDVITSDGAGNAVNNGPYSNNLRSADQQEDTRVRELVPSWILALLGAAALAALIACFATGVCEVAAVVGGLGFAAAAVLVGIMKAVGIKDTGNSEA